MSARRSHPPSLLRHVERLARDDGLFRRGDVVLCACSGGPDSTALLHALAFLRRRIGHEVVAHGVDHGLRSEAPAELELARRVATKVGVPFEVTRVDLAPGSNLQARARDLRHRALATAAARASAKVIALGHTADDRAETFLLRLLRGSGPRGLAVMPSRSPSIVGDAAGSTIDLVRPLLAARRSDVMAHLARHELAFAQDPSNEDPRFTRVRVRRELVPLLEQLSPAIVPHLGLLAEMLAALHDPAAPELPLGRAQRLSLERARRLGRDEIVLRVRGGVDVTFPAESGVLTDDE